MKLKYAIIRVQISTITKRHSFIWFSLSLSLGECLSHIHCVWAATNARRISPFQWICGYATHKIKTRLVGLCVRNAFCLLLKCVAIIFFAFVRVLSTLLLVLLISVSHFPAYEYIFCHVICDMYVSMVFRPMEFNCKYGFGFVIIAVSPVTFHQLLKCRKFSETQSTQSAIIFAYTQTHTSTLVRARNSLSKRRITLNGAERERERNEDSRACFIWFLWCTCGTVSYNISEFIRNSRRISIVYQNDLI